MQRLFSRFSHNTVSLIVLGMLIFLRIPFLASVATLWEQTLLWANIVFITATYLLTAFLIWWERDRLSAFWIDLAGAIIFLCQMYLFPFGIGLFAAMRRSKARFPTPTAAVLRWALAGALLGILAVIFIIQAHLYPAQERDINSGGLFFLFSAALMQMTNAAVWEEPLFRGFLWGHLRLAGWKNAWIWLFQALLFTLAHFYYLRSEQPVLFFIRIMIPALLIGLIAWRARSIAAGMVTHGFMNATFDLLTHTGTLSSALSTAWTGAGILTVGLVLALGFGFYQSRRLPAAAPE